MENLDKNFDPKVMIEFRKELHCKKDSFSKTWCQIDALCFMLWIIVQYESKDPKIPTFIQNSGLVKAIPGFKTHPCANVKNGCDEEIPGNLDDLKKHDQSCPFRKVPCPYCKETLIFKNLVDHLKEAHVIQS